MCHEVGAYPKCNCPDFVTPDSTPGVMTWDELTEYMDKLVGWSGDTIKGWKTVASELQTSHQSCTAMDKQHRVFLQNMLAKECDKMCHEVGAYPKCNCPDFVTPDSTPGVMTWDELTEYMDKLVGWSGDTIKGWKSKAAEIQVEESSSNAEKSCEAKDRMVRVFLQNKLAKECDKMCHEVGAYPKCNCPEFVAPDSTPGVMTWDELTEYMDKLVGWSGDTIKGWKTVASELQTSHQSCTAMDKQHRVFLQNMLAKECDKMCHEVGAYPKCNCPDFVTPDSTPGVMTWDELTEYMDKLVGWSGDTIKGWKSKAAEIQVEESSSNAEKSCEAKDRMVRVFLQNKLAKECDKMCHEVGAYPKCNCPEFVAPDSTPGVMTWDELTEYMDKLVGWSGDTIKGWKTVASELQTSHQSCTAMDKQHRVFLQNMLAKECDKMCHEVGAYPKCNCPDFVTPDSTPGVMTWDELTEYMDKLVGWSGDTIKGWKSTAAQIQVAASPVK
ncbi:unnamed protein product [Prorocentrum cordatum]|uniref:Uncharacterized protein n=1 Tax=Prorocentrum cordatum TaxID=2364126 RepID=A0ABN9UJ73_9DINO|nr:unnamed protein product [Polarella glacialis]